MTSRCSSDRPPMRVVLTMAVTLMLSAVTRVARAAPDLPMEIPGGEELYVYGSDTATGPSALRVSATEDDSEDWAAFTVTSMNPSIRTNGLPAMIVAAAPRWLDRNASFAYYAAGFSEGAATASWTSQRFEVAVDPMFGACRQPAAARRDLMPFLAAAATAQRQRLAAAAATGALAFNVSETGTDDQAALLADSYAIGMRDGYQRVFADGQGTTLQALSDAELYALSIADSELPVLLASTVGNSSVAGCNASLAGQAQLLAFERRRTLAFLSPKANTAGANVVSNYTMLFPGAFFKTLLVGGNVAGAGTPGAPGPNLGHALVVTERSTVTIVSSPALLTAGVRPAGLQLDPALQARLEASSPAVVRLLAALFRVRQADPESTSATAQTIVNTLTQAGGGKTPLSATQFLVAVDQVDDSTMTISRLEEDVVAGTETSALPSDVPLLVVDGTSVLFPLGTTNAASARWVPIANLSSLSTLGEVRAAWNATLRRAVASMPGSTLPSADLPSDATDALMDTHTSVLRVVNNVFNVTLQGESMPLPDLSLSPRFDISTMPRRMTTAPGILNPASVRASAAPWLVPSLAGVVASSAAPLGRVSAGWRGIKEMPAAIAYGPAFDASDGMPPASVVSWIANTPSVLSALYESEIGRFGWTSRSATFANQPTAVAVPVVNVADYRVPFFQFGALWVIIVVTAIGGPAIFIMCAFALRRGAMAAPLVQPPEEEDEDHRQDRAAGKTNRDDRATTSPENDDSGAVALQVVPPHQHEGSGKPIGSSSSQPPPPRGPGGAGGYGSVSATSTNGDAVATATGDADVKKEGAAASKRGGKQSKKKKGRKSSEQTGLLADTNNNNADDE